MKNFLKFYSEKFSKFLCEDGWFLTLLLILNLPIFFQEFFLGTEIRTFHELLNDSIIKYYSGAVLILLLCVLINFGLSKFPRAKFFVQSVILVISAASFFIDAFLIYNFQLTLQENMIMIVLGTNPATVREFFQNYILNPKIIFLAVLIVFLLTKIFKHLRRIFFNLSENALKRLCNYTIIILLPEIIFLLPAIIFDLYFNREMVFKITTDNVIMTRNLLKVHNALKNSADEQEIFAEMDSQDEKIISNNSQIPYVVFVLGEATTRNHMQLYGYKLENNPLLLERYKRGELFKFNDVIACANYTFTAMELIFTFSEKDTPEKNWYKTPNIFDILRRAGYHTVWISNQSAVGLWDNTDNIFSKRCDEKFFAENANDGKIFSRDLDGVLLPALDNFLVSPHEKNFYCVHLYGAHAKYNERYPEEFAKFTAVDEDKPTEKAKKFTAEYDNAILYNDFIMDEIFKRFEDKNALIIYISDHGEEVFENGRDFAGHSWEELGNRSMIEIPMLVWTSKIFREMYSEKVDALKNSCDNPYRTDLIIHTILDLMDIRTENFDATKSIVNENFDKSRQRIYNGKLYIKY